MRLRAHGAAAAPAADSVSLDIADYAYPLSMTPAQHQAAAAQLAAAGPLHARAAAWAAPAPKAPASTGFSPFAAFYPSGAS